MLFLEAVWIRRVVREGSGLKYPAVNVQDVDLFSVVAEERVWRRVRRAGSSVDVEGGRSWVNWERG